MKMVKKIFYSNAERVKQLTSEALRKIGKRNYNGSSDPS